MSDSRCALCTGSDSDDEMGRIEVWSDEQWRLTTSVGPGDPTLGFSYLEPRRHIPHIEDLDGDEAATFGPVIARCSRALKEATQAERVFVYVFGDGIPHLHVHLAPHNDGDALNGAMLRGELVEQRLSSGAVALQSKDFPALPEAESRAAAQRVRDLLSS